MSNNVSTKLFWSPISSEQPRVVSGGTALVKDLFLEPMLEPKTVLSWVNLSSWMLSMRFSSTTTKNLSVSFSLWRIHRLYLKFVLFLFQGFEPDLSACDLSPYQYLTLLSVFVTRRPLGAEVERASNQNVLDQSQCQQLNISVLVSKKKKKKSGALQVVLIRTVHGCRESLKFPRSFIDENI